MSRTRIIKGKLTEIVHRDYNIYSASSIIDNAAGEITEKGVEKGVSYGNPEKPSEGEIKAKCVVQFRPHNRYHANLVVKNDKKEIKDMIKRPGTIPYLAMNSHSLSHTQFWKEVENNLKTSFSSGKNLGYKK